MVSIFYDFFLNFVYVGVSLITSVEFLFFSLLFILIILFNQSITTFFRVIILILILFTVSTYLIYLGLDFFAGFLLVFELPVMLIASIFYFHKHGVKFDSIYNINLNNKMSLSRFLYLIIIILFFTLLFNYLYLYTYNHGFLEVVFNNVFIYNISDHIYSSFRNDFLVWFTTIYVDQPIIVILLGLMIFIVSYVIIVLYYMYKAHNLVKKKKNESNLIQRKQQLNRQSTFNNKLSFFINRVSTSKVESFLDFLTVKDKLFLETEKLLAELEPYRRTRKIIGPKGRSYWYHLERLYKKPEDDIQLPWTDLMFDIRFFGVYDEELNDFFYEELIIVIEANEYILSNILSFVPEDTYSLINSNQSTNHYHLEVE